MKTVAVILASYIFSLSILPVLDIFVGLDLHCCISHADQEEYHQHACSSQLQICIDDKNDNTAINISKGQSSEEGKDTCSNCNPFCCHKCVSSIIFLQYSPVEIVNSMQYNAICSFPLIYIYSPIYEIWDPPA